MANEFLRMPNPDNIPRGVTTGYQRQNTNMYAIQTGTDTTEPYDNGQGVITIPAGGVVEYNGVLFRITNNVTLTKPNKNIAYWIAINDNGDGTANPGLVTRPGAWNPAKQGCYDSQNRRTLNWVSLGSLSGSPGTAIFSENVKGTWEINLRKGWYYVNLASGKGGGNGGNGINGTGNTRAYSH